MFQHVYGSLPTSVFDRVGVLRELSCVRYGYCSQALLSSDENGFYCSVFVLAVMYILCSFSFIIVYF